MESNPGRTQIDSSLEANEGSAVFSQEYGANATMYEQSTEELSKVEKERIEKENSMRNISAILDKLSGLDNPGSVSAEMLRPVKKGGRLAPKKDLVTIPELLDVRAPGSSKHTNLSKSVKGHKKVDDDRVWVIPSAYAPIDDFAKARVITPDGRIFDNFTELKQETSQSAQEQEKKMAVDLGSQHSISDLPLKHVKLIEKYLTRNYDQAEKPNAEEDPVARKDRLVEETRDKIEALSHLDEGTDEYAEAERRVRQSAHELKQAQDIVNGTKDEAEAEESDSHKELRESAATLGERALIGSGEKTVEQARRDLRNKPEVTSGGQIRKRSEAKPAINSSENEEDSSLQGLAEAFAPLVAKMINRSVRLGFKPGQPSTSTQNIQEAAIKREFEALKSEKGAKKAKRVLAKRYHPDINPEGEEKMKIVSNL